MHIDTGHNYDELYQFRDDLVKETKARLIISSVQKSIDEGKVIEKKVLIQVEINCKQPLC